MSRKIRGVFCESELGPKSGFDSRSFRWKRSGRAWVLVACPRGQWAPRARRCKVGLKGYKLLKPAKGSRCSTGTRILK